MVYVYSCMANDRFIVCESGYSTMEEAADAVMSAEEETVQFGTDFFGDKYAEDYVSEHRVFIIDEDGDCISLGAEEAEEGENPKYQLYVGYIGESLELVVENEDCDFLIDRYNSVLEEIISFTSLINKELSEEVKADVVGIILKSNDRNFICPIM